MNAKPISEKSNSGCGPIALSCFGSLFLIMGLVVFWFLVVQPLLQLNNAMSWSTTQATVTAAQLKVHHSNDGTSYSAEIDYQYDVGDVTYNNDRYGFFNISAGRRAAQKRVDNHPVGSQIDIFFNPDDPADSVISREVGWGLAFGLIPLLFVAVGGVIIVGALYFGWGSARARQTTTGVSTGELSSLMVVADQSDEDQKLDGPQKLKPESSRLVVFILVLVACLFWNGIVGVFAYNVIDEGFPIFETLFLTPFLLVGIGLLTGTVYCFLAIFNPVIEIAMSNGAVPPGAEVDIAWEVKGNASRIRKLTLMIQGEESATYRQGTDTRTDTEVFKRINIADTSNKNEIQFGTTSITIPSNTMHSFKSSNNEIKWSIVVHGDIPWWPDVNQTMIFRVKP